MNIEKMIVHNEQVKNEIKEHLERLPKEEIIEIAVKYAEGYEIYQNLLFQSQNINNRLLEQKDLASQSNIEVVVNGKKYEPKREW